MLIAHQPSDQPVITRFKAGVQPVAVGSPKFGKKTKRSTPLRCPLHWKKLKGSNWLWGKLIECGRLVDC